jgi:hypothetical protein
MFGQINVLQGWVAPLCDIVTKAYRHTETQRESGRGGVADKQNFSIRATT